MLYLYVLFIALRVFRSSFPPPHRPSLAMYSPRRAAPEHARVLEVVLLRVAAVAGQPSSAHPPGSAPPDEVLAAWSEVCNLIDRTRQTREYAPPSHRARRFVARMVNRVNWLLMRAFAPSSQYRRLTPARLLTEYCLPQDLGEVARRAVRLSWIRRLVLALRILYSYLNDLAEIPTISLEAIRPTSRGW